MASDGEARARIQAILSGGGDGLPLSEAAIVEGVTGFSPAAAG